MKMKKILNEWRKFINEGASNEEIRNKEIAKINNSRVSSKEAQRQIASIYLPMTLMGHEPRGAKQFYMNKVDPDGVIWPMLKQLLTDIEVHKKQNNQTTESDYFMIETVGELANEKTTVKTRLRSKIKAVSNAAQGIFQGPDDLIKRIYEVIRMLMNQEYNFSKLTPDYEYSFTKKGGFHRGADTGVGGIKVPKDKMSPEEIAEDEKMMEKFSMAHHEYMRSIDKPKDREFYLSMNRWKQQQSEFYEYLYSLWLDKEGPKHPMTKYFKTVIDNFEHAVDIDFEAAANLIPDTPEKMTIEQLSDAAMEGDEDAAKQLEKVAREGNKKAAEKAFRMFRSKKQNDKAAEMRNIMRGR